MRVLDSNDMHAFVEEALDWKWTHAELKTYGGERGH